MADQAVAFNARQVARTALFGAGSVVLYVCLFLFERDVLALSMQGGWRFLIPVGIALVFSIVHGTFTGSFWDALGIRAKR